MQFTLIVDINDADIEYYCEVSESTQEDAIKEITNTMYLGLSCIDGMVARQFEITGTDSYVHSITDKDDNEY